MFPENFAGRGNGFVALVGSRFGITESRRNPRSGQSPRLPLGCRYCRLRLNESSPNSGPLRPDSAERVRR